MISPQNSSFKISVGIRNATDFSPFGVELKGRNFEVVGGGNYRYSFQGQETDSEIKGEGNSYDFGARMLDARLGKFLSRDPSFSLQPGEGVYNFAGNSPIYYIDLQGNFKWPGTKKEQKALENKYPNFTKIMKNIHEMPDMFGNLIDEMSKQTGLSASEIKSNLNYGSGAIIKVGQTTNGAMSTPNISEIHVDEDLLNAFESLEGTDLEIATVALAITLLHEEVHRGDRITNGGLITGQFEYKQAGIGFVIGTQGDLLEGKQDTKTSTFGHRGIDLEVNVFGAPGDKVFKKYNNDPKKIMKTGGYTLDIDQWKANPSIKASEQKSLIDGIGKDKLKTISNTLQK